MKIFDEIRDIALSDIPREGFWSAIREAHGTPIGQAICDYSSVEDRMDLWFEPEATRMALLFVAEAIEQEAV